MKVARDRVPCSWEKFLAPSKSFDRCKQIHSKCLSSLTLCMLETAMHLLTVHSFTFTEKKAKQRDLDMDCQRHNSEAVIKGMEEKLKEKDKEHRCVKKFPELIVLFWTVTFTQQHSLQADVLSASSMIAVPTPSPPPLTWRGMHDEALRLLFWENSWPLLMPPLLSPRNDVWAAIAEIPYWWQIRVVFLIGWSKVEAYCQPISSTTQICVVLHYQYGISMLFSQTSFRRKASGGIRKWRLFSQAIRLSATFGILCILVGLQAESQWRNKKEIHCVCNVDLGDDHTDRISVVIFLY